MEATTGRCGRPERSIAALLTMAVIFLLSGCGGGADAPPLASASGTVTFDGQPVKSGRIFFSDSQRGAVYQAEITEGNFTVSSYHGEGMPLGSYQVHITPRAPAAPENSTDPAVEIPLPEAPDIPQEYRDFSTSGFTAEIKENMEPLKFEMQAG